MTSTAATDRTDDEYLGEHHVYEPRRAGLPHLGRYMRELWRRRHFAFELSRTTMRAQHFDTLFGKLWLVLNPMLLASAYYLLVFILGSGSRGAEFFAHLLAGIFVYYFVSGSITTGAGSVVGGGKLILNTAFPRLLLPLSSTHTAFRRFLPTLVVYAAAHLIVGLRVGPRLLWAVPVLAEIVVFAAGLAMFFATLQVYFRDASSFLPYIVRIWLYLSPVIYYAEEVPERLRPFMAFNPLFPLLANWSGVLTRYELPSTAHLLSGGAWALGTLLVGALFFVSKEREFAVRL